MSCELSLPPTQFTHFDSWLIFGSETSSSPDLLHHHHKHICQLLGSQGQFTRAGSMCAHSKSHSSLSPQSIWSHTKQTGVFSLCESPSSQQTQEVTRLQSAGTEEHAKWNSYLLLRHARVLEAINMNFDFRGFFGSHLLLYGVRLSLYTYTVTTLLGRPVHQLVNANIETANHVAATKCINASRRGQGVQLFFRPNGRIAKKCDVSDFAHGMIVGARQGEIVALPVDWPDGGVDTLNPGGSEDPAVQQRLINPANLQWPDLQGNRHGVVLVNQTCKATEKRIGMEFLLLSEEAAARW